MDYVSDYDVERLSQFNQEFSIDDVVDERDERSSLGRARGRSKSKSPRLFSQEQSQRSTQSSRQSPRRRSRSREIRRKNIRLPTDVDPALVNTSKLKNKPILNHDDDSDDECRVFCDEEAGSFDDDECRVRPPRYPSESPRHHRVSKSPHRCAPQPPGDDSDDECTGFFVEEKGSFEDMELRAKPPRYPPVSPRRRTPQKSSRRASK
eukprot:7302872-Ditylum_brightwellii.AAC.1